MNKEWVEERKTENRKKYESLKPIFIKNILKEFPFFKEEDIENILTTCMNKEYYGDMRFDFAFSFKDKLLDIIEDEETLKAYKYKVFSYLLKDENHNDFFKALNDLRRTYGI